MKKRDCSLVPSVGDTLGHKDRYSRYFNVAQIRLPAEDRDKLGTYLVCLPFRRATKTQSGRSAHQAATNLHIGSQEGTSEMELNSESITSTRRIDTFLADLRPSPCSPSRSATRTLSSALRTRWQTWQSQDTEGCVSNFKRRRCSAKGGERMLTVL